WAEHQGDREWTLRTGEIGLDHMQHFFNFIQCGILSNHPFTQQLHHVIRLEMKTRFANPAITLRWVMGGAGWLNNMDARLLHGHANHLKTRPFEHSKVKG